MSELQAIQGYLTEAGLKFIPVNEQTLGLLFRGDAREQMVVQVSASPDLVIALSAAPVKLDDELALQNLLRVTMDADMMKVFSSQNDVMLACEAPQEHVRKGSMEGIIRQLVQAVDATPETVHDLDKYQQAVLMGTMLCRQAAGALYSGPAAAAIPEYCRATGIECTKIDETKFRIHSSGGILKLNIVVVCRETLVTFLAFTDLKCTDSRLDFYHRLLDLNRRVNVARVAMDKDGELCFIYEMPGINPGTFQRAVQTLEQTVALYMMGTEGATPGAPTPPPAPVPAPKPESGGFLSRLFKKK